MKNYLSIMGIIILLLAFPACEKVIEIDVANAKEVIVIEALMTIDRQPFTVQVSKTTPYFGASSSNPVSGAVVSIRSEKGKPRYFVEKEPGYYVLPKIHALAGFWYIVDVKYEGIKYSARSFMHERVSIADIGFTYFDGYGIFDSGYKVNTFIRDPENTENYYKIKFYVNGKPTTNPAGFSLYSDELFNGKAIGLGQRSMVFKRTDTLTVELQTIDKATYDYFSTLESISGLEVLQSISPSNPISNFDNGALGYFSAFTLDSKTVIINDYVTD